MKKLIENLEVGYIVKVIDGTLIAKGKREICDNVCQDSRVARENSIFFAIKGEAFDGHDYIENVILNKASLVVIENIKTWENIISKAKKNEKLQEEIKNTNVVLVKNTIESLQKLSGEYLNAFSLKKIAITGSTGKTTTRDILYNIVKEKFIAHKNDGNLNSNVGVPLTIFDTPKNSEVAIVEMGMDKFFEIESNSQVYNQEFAIITNIGISHLGNFESEFNIFEAKMEIAKYMSGRGILIVWEDDKFLSRDNIEKFKLSKQEDSSYKGWKDTIFVGDKSQEYRVDEYTDLGSMGSQFTFSFKDEKVIFKTSLRGYHNIKNLSLCIVASYLIGISFDEIKMGIKSVKLTGKRLEVREVCGVKIIDDTYNASPDSMRAAVDFAYIEILENKKKNQNARLIFVLGDMKELGVDSNKYHRDIIEYASRYGDKIYLIGEEMNEVAMELTVDKTNLIEELISELVKDDIVLFKASRSLKLDEVVEKLIRYLQER